MPNLKYSELQKQPSRGVLRKICSEYMQQIYRRTTMPKYDFKYDWTAASEIVNFFKRLRVFPEASNI